ncbi:uncharacterized protein KY384_000692 [Bacidia gigantensis]|uniref:uncharacterized protein n=1 Tax=Bacidia gigantensis TaxID=2732470 RepID=UPI001D03919A|nr:uncharacterized protein KY384_000692 [Bacidia gigantensis]KAG8525930.1 hypothetical protein KY384_000692 [Bacidia gigantensis]
MHILVTNDDGPPSNQSSPYVHPFISALQSAGHIISVVLPHQQRSWIGKAHFVHQTVQPVSYTPSKDPHSGGEGSSTQPYRGGGGVATTTTGGGSEGEKWVLVDGTPATCTQLGLFHLFKDRTPFDLVVSGPNYGKNTTSLFSLSSGTIGGALEAATFGVKAIALSFAHWTRNHDPEIVEEACKHSVALIEKIGGGNYWGAGEGEAGKGADLWNANVPLQKGVSGKKVMVCPILESRWRSGSCFEEVGGAVVGEEGKGESEAEQAAEREYMIREGDEDGGAKGDLEGKTVAFTWAPKYDDVARNIKDAGEGSDGWAITQGFTRFRRRDTPIPHIYAIVDADDFLLPLLHSALRNIFPPANTLALKLIESLNQLPTPSSPLLQLTSYELVDFSHLLAHPNTSLANAYVIRKALIRKHYLSQTVSTWLTKHPSDRSLRGHVPETESFELDFAEFLDEALVECWGLKESFVSKEREWWVLKPGMSEQGQGVRLFSSEEELRRIFEQWEDEQPSEDEEEDDGGTDTPVVINGAERMGAGTMTSQLRHFVVQRYIDRPLLFEELGRRKFHIRSYVLASGALKVYVYREMLALFASLPYKEPGEDGDMDERVHLTNTCLQAGTLAEGSVHRYWDLPPSNSTLTIPQDWHTQAFKQIQAATGTLFEAAAREQMIHFQTLPNAFEVFGVDWMVDEDGNASLLEVNAFPDFKQSGEGLKDLVAGFWQQVVRIAVGGFFGSQDASSFRGSDEMIKVLDLDLGRN